MKKIDARCPQPTPDELQTRWSHWTQAMELSHAMLMAGLKQRAGPDGDLHTAYREWYDRYQSLKWKNFTRESPPSESLNAT